MDFPAPRTSYPSANEMADYLGAYADRYDLPVRTGMGVDSPRKGRRPLRRERRRSTFRSTTTWWSPPASSRSRTFPTSPSELDPSITQLHSNAYRNLSQLQDGRVLVVGASHSGSDIAFEAASKHEVVLSGKDTGQLPAPIESRRGRFLFRGLFFVGTHVLTVDTPPGRKMRTHIRHGGAPLLRYRRKDLRAAGVERVLARTVGVENGLPVLDDGRVLDVRNVVWCTGFRPEYSGSASRSRSARTATPCSTEASSRRRRACTWSACRSCTRSRRCSSAARAEMPSASSSTSSRTGPRSRRRLSDVHSRWSPKNAWRRDARARQGNARLERTRGGAAAGCEARRGGERVCGRRESPETGTRSSAAPMGSCDGRRAWLLRRRSVRARQRTGGRAPTGLQNPANRIFWARKNRHDGCRLVRDRSTFNPRLPRGVRPPLANRTVMLAVGP